MVNKKEKSFYVRENWISFHMKEINKAFRLSEQKDGSNFKKIKKEPDH